MGALKRVTLPEYTAESGRTIKIELSYQTFGKKLGEASVVVVNHALTGNSNVTGTDGWWRDLIGENKCIDTKVYTVLAFNVPGAGTGESEIAVTDHYKDFNTRDIAALFLLGLAQLKIERVFAVIGGSTGGGIAWEMAALQPKFIEHLIPVAADWKSTDWVIANCYIQDSILNNSVKPLFDARMHAMTLYRTPESLQQKFKRVKNNDGQFQVESWFMFHGMALTNRFRLSAYKLMNQILKTTDITRGRGSFVEVISGISSRIHLVTIPSDLLFKNIESWNTFNTLKALNKKVAIHEIVSIHGHDAFLIEYNQLAAILAPVFAQNNGNTVAVKSIEKLHDK